MSDSVPVTGSTAKLKFVHHSSTSSPRTLHTRILNLYEETTKFDLETSGRNFPQSGPVETKPMALPNWWLLVLWPWGKKHSREKSSIHGIMPVLTWRGFLLVPVLNFMPDPFCLVPKPFCSKNQSVENGFWGRSWGSKWAQIMETLSWRILKGRKNA